MLKLYELRLFDMDRPTADEEPQIHALDLEQVADARDLLTRLLVAAAKRNRARDGDLYRYSFAARPVNADLDLADGPVFRWALPVEGWQVPTWAR